MIVASCADTSPKTTAADRRQANSRPHGHTHFNSSSVSINAAILSASSLPALHLRRQASKRFDPHHYPLPVPIRNARHHPFGHPPPKQVKTSPAICKRAHGNRPAIHAPCAVRRRKHSDRKRADARQIGNFWYDEMCNFAFQRSSAQLDLGGQGVYYSPNPLESNTAYEISENAFVIQSGRVLGGEYRSLDVNGSFFCWAK